MSQSKSKEDMKEAMSNMETLTISQMEKYAKNKNVNGFYYTGSVSFNGNSKLDPVDTTGTSESSEEETSSSSTDNANAPGGNGQGMPESPDGDNDDKGGKGGRMGQQGDFTVTGYSSDEAMTDFVDGTKTITSGKMFDENDTGNNCVISEELATYNSLKVGDKIKLTNPNDESETYKFTVVGIYKSKSTSDSTNDMMGGFSPTFDSANQIYTSYDNLKNIVTKSTKNATTSTDSTTGMETTTALRMQENGTYTFKNIESYENFKKTVEKKLGDNYSVVSNDVDSYENSLVPLENLSKYAGYFLIIILAIGGLILIVLNIFNIRERKYEIGVLSAIGMKKSKIALQFITELLCITCIAIVLGAGSGAITSVPITNKLLEQQVENSTKETQQTKENFGRDAINGKNNDNKAPNMKGDNKVSYISEISSATNVTVILQLIGIGLLLTIVAGGVAMISILKFDPLRILSSRD